MRHLFQILGSFLAFTFHKVVYVSTRLRCDGIFNDKFITLSLQSPRVKKWKSVNLCGSYGQLSTGSFFFTAGRYA